MTTTDTNVQNLIINTMTKATYDSITPSATELYLITDESPITSSDVTTALGYTPYNGTTNPNNYISSIPATYLKNTATGTYALTILGTASSYTASVNVGSSSSANANYSTAIGYLAGSSSTGSTAIGYNASAGSSYSTAIGYNAKVSSAMYAIQLGYGTNSLEKSLSIGFSSSSFELLDGLTGLIPDERINGGIRNLLAGDGISITRDSDGINWQRPILQDSTLSSNSDNGWSDLAYGNGKFVIISATGYISTSTDGETWTTPTNPLDSYSWLRITYGNNKFVALGFNGHISTSTDGLEWTTIVLPSGFNTRHWYGLAYGNNKFVALDYYGYISTSVDGETWTTPTQDSNLSNQSNWSGLAYGNNKFVAITATAYVATSTDGENWTLVQNADLVEHDWRDLAFGNGKFVAIGNLNYTSTSIDGITWVSNPKVSTNASNWMGIAYGNGRFIATNMSGYLFKSIPSSTTISTNLTSNIINTALGYTPQDSSTAVTHTASTAVGNSTTPVYIASDGTATACSRSLLAVTYDATTQTLTIA